MAWADRSAAGQCRAESGRSGPADHPTAFRNNYLAALSGTSQGAGQGESLISTLTFAQRWTAAVDWSTYESARADGEGTNGFLDPAVAENSGRRLRLSRVGPRGEAGR